VEEATRARTSRMRVGRACDAGGELQRLEARAVDDSGSVCGGAIFLRVDGTGQVGDAGFIRREGAEVVWAFPGPQHDLGERQGVVCGAGCGDWARGGGGCEGDAGGSCDEGECGSGHGEHVAGILPLRGR
jgi:hypothetical protein